MSTEKVEIVATARDQASAVLKKLNGNVAALGNKGRGPLGGLLSGLGGISPVTLGASVAVGALTAALADGVAGALAEDKQMARLSATLKANVKDWDGSTAAVDRATTAAMDLSFSDDDARESMIKLITANGNVADSARDMSLAMNIARGRNIDLATATDIVIKANMGNVGALRRLGIEVKAGAQPLEILTALQNRYAGQAEAYANTTAGKFESAQAKVNNAMEDAGHFVINTAAGFLSFDSAMKGSTQSAIDFIHSSGAFIPFLTQVADEMQRIADIHGKVYGEAHKPFLDAILNGGGGYGMTQSQMYDAERAARGIVDPLMPGFEKAGEEAAKTFSDAFGDRLSDNLVGDLKNTKHVLKQAWHDINWALNHPHALENKLGKIQVMLDSDKLDRLLNSKNPQQQAIGRQIQSVLEGQASALTGTEYQSGVTSIVGAINSLRGYLRTGSSQAPGKTSDTTIDGFVFHRDAPYNPPHYAKGGYLGANRWGMVGENGPEFIRTGRQGVTVTPQSTGSHGHTIVMDGRVVAQLVDERLGAKFARMPTSVIPRG